MRAITEPSTKHDPSIFLPNDHASRIERAREHQQLDDPLSHQLTRTARMNFISKLTTYRRQQFGAHKAQVRIHAGSIHHPSVSCCVQLWLPQPRRLSATATLKGPGGTSERALMPPKRDHSFWQMVCARGRLPSEVDSNCLLGWMSSEKIARAVSDRFSRSIKRCCGSICANHASLVCCAALCCAVCRSNRRQSADRS